MTSYTKEIYCAIEHVSRQKAERAGLNHDNQIDGSVKVEKEPTDPVTVQDITSLVNCSSATIRREIKSLDEDGVIQVEKGGKFKIKVTASDGQARVILSGD